MKLLFDENLSRKLVQRLEDLYAGSAHVVGVGLMQSSDREIWDFAKANGFVVVSTDLDLYDLATTLGPPPKVVWLRWWTHPTADATTCSNRSGERLRNSSGLSLSRTSN